MTDRSTAATSYDKLVNDIMSGKPVQMKTIMVGEMNGRIHHVEWILDHNIKAKDRFIWCQTGIEKK